MVTGRGTDFKAVGSNLFFCLAMSEGVINEHDGLSFEALKKTFSGRDLFKDKTWLLSPQAFGLSATEMKEIQALGQACYDFYRALELLYVRSSEGKNLLRNRELLAPWVAEYLNRGKPDSLVAYGLGRGVRGALPPVIRPDLLLTDEGFAMTELDSVPGGIGLTAFFNALYKQAHGSQLAGCDGDKGEDMVDAFYRVLAAKAPNIHVPYIVILVSDEAETYRPEMEWIAKELRNRGRRVHVFHPDAVMPLGDSICVGIDGDPQAVDVVYRFWELFDLSNVSIAEYLLGQCGSGNAKGGNLLPVVPPMRAFQEEKLSMALFHHRILEDFWREHLSRKSYAILKKTIPQTWVMDPVELPPNAVLDAPFVNGKPIARWEQLIDAGKRERNLILKISGFHESAWGARSVVLGSDSSREEWEEAIWRAVSMASTSLHILQVYKKPKRVVHPVYSEEGSVVSMEGRVRLCPYYFVDDAQQAVDLRGILATLCPADKKIIHGMKDASLIPCICRD